MPILDAQTGIHHTKRLLVSSVNENGKVKTHRVTNTVKKKKRKEKK